MNGINTSMNTDIRQQLYACVIPAYTHSFSGGWEYSCRLAEVIGSECMVWLGGF